jgi:hypothetical protein
MKPVLDSSSLGAFLSGSVVTSVVAFLVAQWKEHRAIGLQHEGELQGAQQEFLACLEEARATCLRLAIRVIPGVENFGPWIETAMSLQTDVLKRLGAARARVMLAEGDHAQREYAVRCAGGLIKALSHAALVFAIADKAEARVAEFNQVVGEAVALIEAYTELTAQRNAAAREARESLMPRAIALRLANRRRPKAETMSLIKKLLDAEAKVKARTERS